MKSLQTKIVLVITLIMLVVALTFGLTATFRINRTLDEDSDRILSLTVDQSYRDMEAMLSSVVQSVEIIYNYAERRVETYPDFPAKETERSQFSYDISELAKSIAEKTPGALSVYLRYNPDLFKPTEGFWYTYSMERQTWNSTEPTDISMYDRNDTENVGWYYIPAETGKPVWLDPYYNQTLGIDIISYVIPYFHKGQVIGVIGMDIDISLLRNFVSGISLYDSGRAYLVSSQGDIIFHFDYPTGVSHKDLSDNLMPFITSVLEGKIDVVQQVTGIDGVKRKILMKKLSNDMILGVNAPVNEINKPQSTLTRQLLILSVLILALAIAVCLVWIRTLIAPLKRMTVVAEHYANGDYSDSMNTDSADEIGILSRSLQSMSTSLKNQIEIADAANRAKSIFLANMSHEIRTPINVILGFDEMILRESSEDSIKTYAANIKGSGQTLLSLINDILDFSKIESGKMEIIPVEYDPMILISDMLDMVMFSATEKGLEIKSEIDSSIPSRLYGDDIRLREILTNLLTNAIKYTETGSVTLRIFRLSSEKDSTTLHISVKDTGIGIREEDKEHLWDSFRRLDQKHNRGIEGTGLGLAITYKYIELMGSRLTLESSYGEGSDFYFDLKQGIIDPTPIGDFRVFRSNAEVAVDIYKEGIEAPDAHILIVDDIELNLAVIKGLLRNSRINIDTASGGSEAIEKMHENRYDIVFLDHMMPEMDGIETLSKIREDDAILSKDIPIIALTANAISGAKNMYTEQGFSDYLSKPVNPSLLEKLLCRYLPKDKLRIKGDSLEQKNPSKTQKNSKKLIDRAAALEYFGGKEDIYQDILGVFIKDDFRARLGTAYEAENWEDYEIAAHALKSSAKLIGAAGLSEEAKKAEESLKSGDSSYVKDCHDGLMEQILAVEEEIRFG